MLAVFRVFRICYFQLTINISIFAGYRLDVADFSTIEYIGIGTKAASPFIIFGDKSYYDQFTFNKLGDLDKTMEFHTVSNDSKHLWTFDRDIFSGGTVYHYKIQKPSVLTGDENPDNKSATVELVTDVSNGTLNLNSDGTFTYSPDIGFYGNDRLYLPGL
jgi:hypothetical protein